LKKKKKMNARVKQKVRRITVRGQHFYHEAPAHNMICLPYHYKEEKEKSKSGGEGMDKSES
jgi:hypothetical protein